MAKIFINYRREDSRPYVDRLQDHLEQLFKEGEVFRDMYSIAPGDNFKEAIDAGIREYDYVLVVIGPKWLSELKKRSTRDTQDYVRLEIAAALQQKKKLIPVLVGGASFPSKRDLPTAIKGLLEKQSFELSNTHFKEDVTRLVDAMGGGWGLFGFGFRFPFGWHSSGNKMIMTVQLSGEGQTWKWLVNSKGKIHTIIVDQKLRKSISFIQARFGSNKSNLADNRVWLPVNSPASFRNIKLKPGGYVITVSLVMDQSIAMESFCSGKQLTQTLPFSLASKSKSFKVLIGGEYRYNAIVSMESIPVGTRGVAPNKNIYRIELEEV